ncbi:MAG: beta-galactosidase trimerization domain-containing protein [Candidatus Sumerlaeota bacterium]|nr:beta-galactosidase trimerization domain-containing protein [Candidatus Sumerlaeota bacterium]
MRHAPRFACIHSPRCLAAAITLFGCFGFGSLYATQQAAVRDGVFFEAEAFDSVVSEDKDFATVVGEPEASDGAVLMGFFREGRATWQFQAPEAGRYTAWLRYGAPGNAKLRVAMDPADPPKFNVVELPATGGAVGPGVWKWAPIWEGDLTQGAHVLALGTAAMRLDCVFLTANAGGRPDDTMLAEVKWPGGPRLPELKHERTITSHPSWLGQRLRVCYAHSEWNKNVTIEQWCEMAAQHGANLINSAGEIPAGMMDGELRPLKVDAKELPEGYQVDYSWVKRYADAAHKQGLKYLCYVNADRTLDPLLLEHPEWREMNAAGKPQDSWGCWNSPYRQAFIDRLVRIARDSKFDGIMIDMPFVGPPGGCRSRYCVEAFQKRFGVDPPRRNSLDDPLYQRWLDFQTWTHEEWLLDLTEALHAVDPEIAVTVNQTRGWIFNFGLRSQFLSTRAGQCVDGLLEEIGWETQHEWNRPWAWPLQDAWQDLFLYCRTRPGQASMWHVSYNMPETELRAQMFSMLANGTAPAVTTGGNWPQMKRAWEHIQGCEPWVCGAAMVPWMAIHYSEDSIAWRANAAGGEETTAFMKNVFGLFQAAIEAHLPVEIITDDDAASVEKLRRYAAVALPNSACLSDAQIAALTEYVQGGGGLLATFETGLFDEFGARRETPGLRDLIGAAQGKTDYAAGWTAKIDDRGHPILNNDAVASSGDWKQGDVEPKTSAQLYLGPTSRQVGMVETSGLAKGAKGLLPAGGSAGRRKGPVKPDEGWAYRGLIVREAGKGKVVYSPLDLGQAYYCWSHPLGRTLIVESLRWAASAPPPIQVEAPMLVQTTLWKKDNATLVHLLNDVSSFGRAAAPNPEAFTGFRAETIPIRDIRIGLPGRFTKARLLPEGKDAVLSEEDGMTWATVPELHEHTLLVAEP